MLKNFSLLITQNDLLNKIDRTRFHDNFVYLGWAYICKVLVRATAAVAAIGAAGQHDRVSGDNLQWTTDIRTNQFRPLTVSA